MTVASPVKKLRQQFADTMLELGQEDPRLVVLIGDISHFILQPFARACSGRFYNVGICEPTIVSMGAGLARAGLVPVLHTIAPFLIERAFEQIKLDFCYHGLGGNLITVGGAFDYASLGCTHHCYGDWALLKTLPGSQIVYPASPEEFDTLFRQTYDNGALTLFRLPEAQHGQVFRRDELRFGRGLRVTEGTNLTVVATGPHLADALGAIEGLKALGWRPEILYFPTIRPLDRDLLMASAGKTRAVLVVEEHMRSGGLSDDVLSALHGIPGLRFASLSIPDRFITDYGSYEHHCAVLGLTPQGLVEKVHRDFGRGDGP